MHITCNKKASVKVKDEVTHTFEVSTSKSDCSEACVHIEDTINKGHGPIATINRKMVTNNRESSYHSVVKP